MSRCDNHKQKLYSVNQHFSPVYLINLCLFHPESFLRHFQLTVIVVLFLNSRHERESATALERLQNCLNAEFIADASIPDETVLKGGQKVSLFS